MSVYMPLRIVHMFVHVSGQAYVHVYVHMSADTLLFCRGAQNASVEPTVVQSPAMITSPNPRPTAFSNNADEAAMITKIKMAMWKDVRYVTVYIERHGVYDDDYYTVKSSRAHYGRTSSEDEPEPEAHYIVFAASMKLL